MANILARLVSFVKHFSGFFTVCTTVARSGKNLLNQRDDVRIAATGRGAVWLAHLHGVQGVAGSNPVAPIFLNFWPFSEDVERLSLCNIKIYVTISVRTQDFQQFAF